MSKEDNMLVGFAIVAIAGDARREVMQALECAKNNQIDKAKAHIEKCNEFITEAHKEQTQILAKEASGEIADMSFIMVHGQDHLMTTMALRDVANYVIDLYQTIHN